jgi:hypothetical protein
VNWTQERNPERRALLDALARSNRAVWEGFSLEANLARVSALREVLEAGCSVEQAASALGVHVSEVDAVAWTGRPDDLLLARSASA